MRACTRSLAALWRPSYWETHHTICPPQHHMSDTTSMSTICPVRYRTNPRVISTTVLYIPWFHSISSSLPTITITRTRNFTNSVLQFHCFTACISHLQIFTVSPPVSILTQCFPLVFPWGRAGGARGTVSTTVSAAVLPRICHPSLQLSPRGLPPPRGWL